MTRWEVSNIILDDGQSGQVIALVLVGQWYPAICTTILEWSLCANFYDNSGCELVCIYDNSGLGFLRIDNTDICV